MSGTRSEFYKDAFRQRECTTRSSEVHRKCIIRTLWISLHAEESFVSNLKSFLSVSGTIHFIPLSFRVFISFVWSYLLFMVH